MRKRSNKGFSLVELIIVIAIMAVLVAVLTPQLLKYVERSRQAKDRANVQAVFDVFNLACIEYGTEDSGGLVFRGGGTVTYHNDGTLKDMNNTIMQRIMDAFGAENRIGASTAFKMPPLTSKLYQNNDVIYRFRYIDINGKPITTGWKEGDMCEIVFAKHPEKPANSR